MGILPQVESTFKATEVKTCKNKHTIVTDKFRGCLDPPLIELAREAAILALLFCEDFFFLSLGILEVLSAKLLWLAA